MSNGLINRQYVGARYVPKIMGEWNKALQYEALSVVTYMGNSFTSKVPVPANVEIDNNNYWVNTGNYNAQLSNIENELKKINTEFNSFKTNTYSLTPEEYGAYGDGKHDDSEAIQNCLNDSAKLQKPVNFMSKIYKINKPININGNNTVINGNNCILLLNTTDYGINLVTNFNCCGLSFINFNIDCGSGNGIKITKSANITIDNINIFNIGDYCNGMYIENQSNKFFIGKIFIWTGTINYSNMTLNPCTFKDTTGIVIKNSYDSLLDNIYCLGTTRGIELISSTDIHIKYMHYWIGSDNNTNKFSTAYYLKTYAVGGSDSRLFIDFFYPDKSYIAVNNIHLCTSYTHLITAREASFIDFNEKIESYIGAVTNYYLTQEINMLSVDTGNDRVYFAGFKCDNLLPFRRNQLNISWEYPGGIKPTSPIYGGMSENRGNYIEELHMEQNMWYLIGYALGEGETCIININSTGTSLNAEFNLLTNSEICKSKMHYKLTGENVFNIAIGNYILSDDNKRVFPIYVRNSQTIDVHYSVKGNNNFIINEARNTSVSLPINATQYTLENI